MSATLSLAWLRRVCVVKTDLSLNPIKTVFELPTTGVLEPSRHRVDLDRRLGLRKKAKQKPQGHSIRVESPIRGRRYVAFIGLAFFRLLYKTFLLVEDNSSLGRDPREVLRADNLGTYYGIEQAIP